MSCSARSGCRRRSSRRHSIASLAIAGLALVVRLLQKSSTQYVFNAIFGIGIGWVFVRWAESSGGSESDQALAFFLPGILLSLGYTVVFGTSCLVGWPVLGFMLGAATEDPIGWHKNKQVVRLCSRLTWVMLIPGAIGVLGQGPIWLLGHYDTIDPDVAVVIILVLRTGLGWALRIGSWALMIWLLARNATPIRGAGPGSGLTVSPGGWSARAGARARPPPRPGRRAAARHPPPPAARAWARRPGRRAGW